MKAEQLKSIQDFLIRTQNTIFPIQLSIKMCQLKKIINEHINTYTEILNKLIDECLVKNENGSPKIDTQGKLELIKGKEEEWRKGTNELENIDFEVTTTITLDELKDIELSPLELEALMPIIKKDSID